MKYTFAAVDTKYLNCHPCYLSIMGLIVVNCEGKKLKYVVDILYTHYITGLLYINIILGSVLHMNDNHRIVKVAQTLLA